MLERCLIAQHRGCQRDRLHTALVEMFADGTIEKILAEYGLDPADALGGTAGE